MAGGGYFSQGKRRTDVKTAEIFLIGGRGGRKKNRAGGEAGEIQGQTLAWF